MPGRSRTRRSQRMPPSVPESTNRPLASSTFPFGQRRVASYVARSTSPTRGYHEYVSSREYPIMVASPR